MKTKIFILIYCLIVFALTVAAQEKPRALKFDEFEEPWGGFFNSYQDEISLTDRAKRFGRQFRKEHGAKAYIIYYLGRITEDDFYRQLDYSINRIRPDIRAENDDTYENVITIFGGYRERTTIEFWIMPKNAELPNSSPTLDKSETFVCPKIYVYDRNLFDESDTLTFSFSEYDLKEFPEATVKWKVFGGEIIGEPETNEIKVKLNDNSKRATAFLEVNALPYPCPKVFSHTAEFNGKLFLIDDFGRTSNGDVKARLDSFISQLNAIPIAKGFAINYGSRAEGKMFSERKKALIRDYLTFRNFDASRITFIDGGYREGGATALWLSFDDNKPIPTPTIDEKFVVTPKSAMKTRSRKKSK